MAEKLYKRKVDSGSNDDNRQEMMSHSIGGLGGKKKKKKKQKKKKARIDPLPLRAREVHTNPDLEYLVEIKTNKSYEKQAKAFLSLFSKNPYIQWDQRGHLLSPITGLNIVTVVRKLVQESTYIDEEELPFYKLLLNTVSIPYDYIKNWRAREQLERSGRPSTSPSPPPSPPPPPPPSAPLTASRPRILSKRARKRNARYDDFGNPFLKLKRLNASLAESPKQNWQPY